MNSRRSFLSTSAAAVLGAMAVPSMSLAALGSGAPTSMDAAIDRFVRRRMAELHVPGLSIAVWMKGKTLFEAAYGNASVELGVPAAIDQVFKLASSSKLLASPCMVRLLAQHKISLNSQVGSLGFDWGRPWPEAWREITIRQLMSHSSGIPSVDELPSYQALSHDKQLSLSVAEAVNMAAAAPLTQRPGSKFIYGQTAYAIMGDIIRQLSKLSYVENVMQQVFRPAGMTSASYGDSRYVIPKRTATDYRLVDGKLVTHWVDYPEITYPAAGCNSTVGDVIKLFAGFYNETILSRDQQELIWSHSVPLGDDVFYGLGVVIGADRRGRRFVGHEGGGQSFNRYYPKEGLASAVLCNLNGSHADDICKTACEIALGDTEAASSSHALRRPVEQRVAHCRDYGRDAYV